MTTALDPRTARLIPWIVASAFGLPGSTSTWPGSVALLMLPTCSFASGKPPPRIDTPPSLSYVTINALWACDGLVVPVPPSGLDFASSAQFWSLLSDLGANLDNQDAEGNRKTVGIAETRLGERRLLEVFTSPIEIAALGRGDDAYPVTAAELAAALRSDEGITGIIVNPAAPWLDVDRAQLAPLLDVS